MTQSDCTYPQWCTTGIRLFLLLLTLFTLKAYALDTENGLNSINYCGDPDAAHQQDSSQVRQVDFDTADMDNIQTQGQIRILLYQRSGICSISLAERRLIEQFTDDQGLTPVWIYVDEEWQLLPTLLAGKGDMVAAAGESLAAGIKGQVEFTLPWTASQLQVVVRTDTSQISNIDDLAVRQVAVKRSSPAWATM